MVALCASLACRNRNDGRPSAYQGVVEFDERILGFEVPGRVRSVAVDRGDLLRQGAQIAALDDQLENSNREARAAEARAARARADLLRAGSRDEDIRAAEAQLAGARQTERVTAAAEARERQLAAAGVSPTSRLDEFVAQNARATAERRTQQERLGALRVGARSQEITAAESQAAAAVSQLAVADERLARHTLVAEFDAVVLDVHSKVGEIVGAGTPVLTVADARHPYVDAFVPQDRLAGIRLGGAATIRVDAESRGFGGRVEDISRRTEFTPRFVFSERERFNLVVRVRVRIDDQDMRLHAGVPAFVTFGAAPTIAGRAR